MGLATKAISRVHRERSTVADGITFDDSGRLWVRGQPRRSGRRRSTENGKSHRESSASFSRAINRDGAPNGLLFPASPVIVGGTGMYVTNLGAFR